MALQGMHHVAFKASDFDRSLRFYTEGLGLTPVLAWGEGDGRAAILEIADGQHLELFAGGTPDAVSEGVLMHFAFHSDDTDADLARAVAAGAEVTMPPTTVEIPSSPAATVHIAFCKGPDGEVIEFFQRLN